nr:ComEC family competence protein [Bacteroidota bacterium]
YLNPISFPFLLVLIVCLGLLSCFWLWERYKLQQRIFFGLITYVIFFSIGYANFTLRKPEYRPCHYSHQIKQQPCFFKLQIKEVLKSNKYSHKYIVEVIQTNEKTSEGKALLSIAKGEYKGNLKVDDQIVTRAQIEAIPSPSNPHQFNYKKYLERTGVFNQFNIQPEAFTLVDTQISSLKGYSEKIRAKIISDLKRTSIEKEQRAIIQALLLGEKKEIDKQHYRDYAAAGALHILAVSGLHVGILYIIIGRVLSFLNYLKKGKYIKSIIIVLLLWGFALLAGLSPSVVRAVTMFSFFALAELTNRHTNSLNTLCLSFFTLLLIAPSWLFQVGFQLSYMAVFFILWIQPKLYSLYTPRFKLDRLLWSISTVTIAAQVGIAPMSIYYFHQFPGLFFITNLVVLPFLGILLCFGIIVIILNSVHALPDLLAIIYNQLIKALNLFIHWVASKEAFLFEDISFSGVQLIGTYVVIMAVISLWKHPSFKGVIIVLGSLNAFLLYRIHEKTTLPKEELIIFHKQKSSLVGYQSQQHLTVFTSDTSNIYHAYPIKDFRVGRGIHSFTLKKTPYVLRFQDRQIIRIDSLGIYASEKNPVVLLTHSPKLHLDRLIDSIAPKLIIADGSNYRSYVLRWKQTCLKKQIPFHSTSEKGSYIFSKKKGA